MDKSEEAFEALCAERGEIVDERTRDNIHWQRRKHAFKDGAAWKQFQDLAHVEAVRTGFTGLDVPCERIAARIKGEEAEKTEG